MSKLSGGITHNQVDSLRSKYNRAIATEANSKNTSPACYNRNSIKNIVT
jgi:hypothetical protein